ncbi:hypothetical protein B0H17DRAFT_1125652 [Mycena rosella]|uniref:Uncharacterized protein n=1 Tax=Mycena rosella TaxID=1033263 RepID=A0AAD7M9Q8_MYCRO|nr:hypothetical protein B0H17DRAFT_1125652 [Mycena rosella]
MHYELRRQLMMTGERQRVSILLKCIWMLVEGDRGSSNQLEEELTHILWMVGESRSQHGDLDCGRWKELGINLLLVYSRNGNPPVPAYLESTKGPKDKDMPYGVEGGGVPSPRRKKNCAPLFLRGLETSWKVLRPHRHPWLLPGVRKTAWEHPTSNSGRVMWGPVIQAQTSDGQLQDLTSAELRSLIHRAFPSVQDAPQSAGRQAYIGSTADGLSGAIMVLRMGTDRLEEIFGSTRILIAHAANV